MSAVSVPFDVQVVSPTGGNNARKRRRAASVVFVAVVYALALAGLGGLYLLLFNPHPDAASPAESSSVAPLVRASTPTTMGPSAAKLDDLKQRLVTYLAGQTGTYGFYLTTHRGTESGGTWLSIGDHEADSFKMASTFKLPLVLYLYSLAHSDTLQLTERLVYEAGFYSGGAGSLQYEDPGDSYTLRDLADRAIRESDNVAQRMLTARLGRQRVLDFMAGLGGTPSYHEGNAWDTPEGSGALHAQAQTTS